MIAQVCESQCGFQEACAEPAKPRSAEQMLKECIESFTCGWQVRSVEDELEEEEVLDVLCQGRDSRGHVKVSRKALLAPPEGPGAPPPSAPRPASPPGPPSPQSVAVICS